MAKKKSIEEQKDLEKRPMSKNITLEGIEVKVGQVWARLDHQVIVTKADNPRRILVKNIAGVLLGAGLTFSRAELRRDFKLIKDV